MVEQQIVYIYTDGACSGNPGPMGIGVYMRKGKRVIEMISQYLGKGTNNTAELTAINIALEKAIFYDEKLIEIKSDSEWAIKILNHQYKCKQPHLLRILKLIREKEPYFSSLKYFWIPREENTVANELAQSSVQKRLK
ncbi:ribonuclease HI family protein [Candidatus Woesearchaeota archaeon]|nr:ribonuclease HI family protein [Candidatus Woesearchaeota archaeon]